MSSSDDRSVLLELFRATSGPSWHRNGGWDTNASVSTWHGVTVDEDGRVVKLKFFSNCLRGAIPESLGKLTNLTKLNLWSNKLTAAIPESLGQLTNLTELNLRLNELTGAIPDSLGRLTNLTVLYLPRNKLTGAIPESLGQLTNLKSLDLSNNQLTGAIPESLGRLTNLTWLVLTHSRLTGPIPEFLGQLTNLTSLDLSSNNLSGAIPESLRKLTNLQSLDLSNNQLTGAIQESLGQLTNLTKLYFLRDKLTGAIPESFGRLTKLTCLVLTDNQLIGPIPESLGQLTNLTELNLWVNELSGAIPESVGQLTNLRRLVLTDNKLTGAIPESLGQLTNLTKLYLPRNKLIGAIPESLGRLTNLTDIALSKNQLTGAIPESLGQLTNLESLDLSNNQLTGAIPESFGQLIYLTSLYLSSNKLTDISEEATRRLQSLRRLNLILQGNPWTNPPADVVDGGLERIVGYWEAIVRSGAIVSWKLKVVLVGAVKAGKTSLVNGMIHGEPHLCHEDDRTKGVDVHVGEPCMPDAERKLELIFWDFAGHSEYYSTHQVFLSKGALHLLVVDLKRYLDEPSARGELVDVWLDALQCRVPGSNVLVVATQIDRFAGNLKAAVGDLRRRVESHLSAQHNEFEGEQRNRSTSLDAQQGLIFHGVETVSSASSDSLMDLRSRLSVLMYTKKGMFPSVGRRRPVSWGRVAAMLDAKRSGKNPILQASRIGNAEQDQNLGTITDGVKFLHRTGAIDDWRRVVRTLKLEKEVGSTMWDIAMKKLKRSGNTERTGKKAVFEDAVGQLVQEGTILDSGKVLHLEPTWINELLRAILDHELADVTKEDFWKDELEEFCSGNMEIYWDLKKIHNNFPSTGILTVKYLRFLWRNVIKTDDEVLLESLLGTMSHHGVIFQGNPSGTGRKHAPKSLDDSAELFVPLHLPSNILVSDLKDLKDLLKLPSRTEMVYEIRQSYVPPGLLGILMARFIRCDGFRFRKCWCRGTAFTLAEVLVLLHLDTPSHGSKETRITVNFFGDRGVSQFAKAMEGVEGEIRSVLIECFGGRRIGPKQGYPLDLDGMTSAFNGYAADGGCNIHDIISASDIIINAVVARIDGLEAHLDRELSRLLQVLDLLEDKLEDVAKSCRTNLARLSKFQPEEMAYPSLVIVRPNVSVGQKRSLRAMVEGIGRRAKNLVCKDMQLSFLCPYDFSEVPCGLDGNGYPLTANREWVKAIRPVLKVTAVLAKVAIKAASGLELPVSDFLNGAMSHLGEEVADRVLDDGAVERALNGSTVPGEGRVKTLVGEAYEELKKFMMEHESKREGYVHYHERMQLVDDGEGRKVWVSNKNVELWKKAHS